MAMQRLNTKDNFEEQDWRISLLIIWIYYKPKLIQIGVIVQGQTDRAMKQESRETSIICNHLTYNKDASSTEGK